jgi:hypothetical protein
VAGPCGYSEEPSGSMQFWEFLELLSSVNLVSYLVYEFVAIIIYFT